MKESGRRAAARQLRAYYGYRFEASAPIVIASDDLGCDRLGRADEVVKLARSGSVWEIEQGVAELPPQLGLAWRTMVPSRRMVRSNEMGGFLEVLEALGSEREAVDEVFDLAPMGVYVDEPEQGCVYANRHLLEIYGVDWERLRGFGWAHYVLEEDVEPLRAEIERFEHEEGWFDFEFRVRRPDDALRWVHARVRALFDAGGTRRGSFGLVRDVTEERTFEERSVQSQKLEAVGRLSGRIAHDFNNVLGSILVATSVLKRDTRDDSDLEMVAVIEEAVEHASAVTGQLLGLARGGEGSARATADLDPQLRSIWRLLKQVLGETVELRMELNAPGAVVGIAPQEVGQVLLNLCINSRDAVEGRGVVIVRTRSQQGAVCLEVEDHGPGIPENLRAKIFAPFFTTKALGRGTGLGLSTVKQLVERGGGTISVQSTLAEGTRMIVELPTVQRRPSGSPQAPAASVPLGRQRILVVDDNDALRQSLAYALALQKHEVRSAASYRTGLAIVEAETLDVLVTDVLLPDGDGPELVQAARTRTPALPVVYMTGFAGECSERIQTDPITALLTKPFTPAQLLGAVASVVRASDTNVPDQADEVSAR